MSSFPSVAGLLSPFAYGRGYVERVNGVAPGAGNNFTHAISGAGYARALAVNAQLVTAATVANRWAELRVTDADGSVWERYGAGVFIPASTTVQLAWSDARGESEWATSGADLTPIFMPMPDRFLQPTEQLRVVIGNIQAGDVLSLIRLTIERFPETPGGYASGESDVPAVRLR